MKISDETTVHNDVTEKNVAKCSFMLRFCDLGAILEFQYYHFLVCKQVHCRHKILIINYPSFFMHINFQHFPNPKWNRCWACGVFSVCRV